MQLHEGKFIARILLVYVETASAGTFRTLLRIAEWLNEYFEEKSLNELVLYVQMWGDETSDWSVTDSLVLQVSSYGRTWTKQMQTTGRMGATDNQVQEVEFNLGYPGGITPASTNDVLRAKLVNWGVTESHRVLVEVQAYMQDLKTPYIERTF